MSFSLDSLQYFTADHRAIPRRRRSFDDSDALAACVDRGSLATRLSSLPRCLAARARALLVVDVRSTLRRCPQPVACITFDEDGVVPRSNADEIGREAPQTVFRSVPGGHLSGCMNGQALAKHVLEFIRVNEPA